MCPRFLVYVESGLVALTSLGTDGKEHTVDLVGPGGFIGEECLEPGVSAAATAELVQASVLWYVDAPWARELLRDRGGFGEAILSGLLRARHRAQARIVAMQTQPAAQRLAKLLLDLSPRDRNGNLLPIGPPPTRQRLAELAGLNRSITSTLMGRFAREGLIAEANDTLQVRPAMASLLAPRSPSARVAPSVQGVADASAQA